MITDNLLTAYRKANLRFSNNRIRHALAWAGDLIPSAVKQTWRRITKPHLVSALTLSEDAFLAKFRLKGMSITKESLLTHLGHRVTPGWPTPPTRIRDLRIKIDELNQDELISLADAILEYRFVLGLHTPELTPDGKIAWHLNPTTDREWLWALNRHQWWPILGLAYAQTGDERYAAAFVTQMLDWVENHPPPAHKNEQSPAWRLMEVGLRMRVSWIPCFALFYNSPTFTDQAKLTMLRSVYDHARFLSLFKTKRNHLLRESNGLAYVGVYFPEFREANHWRQLALARLDRALSEQINRDGSHIEASTGYQSLVIDEYQNTHNMLQSNGLELPQKNLTSWLQRMYHLMAYLIRPDGTFPHVNDGYVYWGYSQLAQAGEIFSRDDFVHIGTRGRQGTQPIETSTCFNDAGWYAMRSDWTEDARYLLFTAGPYGGPHGHEDKLNIELAAFGQLFIVDSSSYTYNRADPFRTYFVSSQAHNTVLVDGKSQIRRWLKENLTPRTALGNYATWISHADFDYVAASYSDGYGSFSLKKPVEANIIRDIVHTRRILFIKPDYWLLVDEIEATSPHNYQVLFHTVPEIIARLGPRNRVILSATPESPSLHLIPVDSPNDTVTCLTGSEVPIQGWYSPGSRQKAPATTVIYERQNCESTVMTTLLYPCPGDRSGSEEPRPQAGASSKEKALGACRPQTPVGHSSPTTGRGILAFSRDVNIEPLTVSGGKGLAFVVTTSCSSDYLLFAHDDDLKQFGPYQTRGVIAGIRTDHNGTVLTKFEWRKERHTA